MTVVDDVTEHDIQAGLAEDLLEKEEYMAAVEEADKVIRGLEPSLPALAQAALVRGKALVLEQMRIMEDTGEMPKDRGVFAVVRTALELSKRLDPDNGEVHEILARLAQLTSQLPPLPPPAAVRRAEVDVLIVGAGASGVGTALMLKTFGLDPSRVLLVERGDAVGETFRRWPAEMRFISPSFNQQGWTNSFDLNSISHNTSPAYSLHAEHPSGQEYAKYLAAIAKTSQLNVKTSTEVKAVHNVSPSEGLPLFEIDLMPTDDGAGFGETVLTRYVVWAAGEFQYPGMAPAEPKPGEEEKKSEEGAAAAVGDEGLIGAALCTHNSTVRSWAALPGDDYVLIGGYESGVDATFNLARAGKRVRLLASRPTWNVQTADPSAELAPYTAARLREVMAPSFAGPRPQLLAPLRVRKVEEVNAPEGRFRVTAEWKKPEEAPTAPMRDLSSLAPLPSGGSEEGATLVSHTNNPPILCTGFAGSVRVAAANLFAFAGEEDAGDDETKQRKKGCLAGAPLLSAHDESTKVPGVFLVGPAVSHGQHSFCFVYKFRQRFAVVANAICRGLGFDTELAVKQCRGSNMYLDDLSCCTDTCGDVC